MNWGWLAWLLFSFRGRIQRLYWWVGSLVVGVVTGMASSTIEFVARSYGLGVVDADTNQFEPTGVLGALLVGDRPPQCVGQLRALRQASA